MQDIKFPTSKEEMNEIYKMLRQEISDDDVAAVSGGNDDPGLQGKNEKGEPWVCPGCGATVMVVQLQDKAKHMTKCPANPFK